MQITQKSHSRSRSTFTTPVLEEVFLGQRQRDISESLQIVSMKPNCQSASASAPFRKSLGMKQKEYLEVIMG